MKKSSLQQLRNKKFEKKKLIFSNLLEKLTELGVLFSRFFLTHVYLGEAGSLLFKLSLERRPRYEFLLDRTIFGVDGLRLF